jgi:hypothetical protein
MGDEEEILLVAFEFAPSQADVEAILGERSTPA